MKKFIASVLCIIMVLTSMSFAVCAEETVNEDRAINLYVQANSTSGEPDKLYAGETLTVTVKLESDEELQHADYVLEYNSTYFKCTEKNFTIAGVAGGYREDTVDATKKKISHYTWSSGDAYTTGEQVLAIYTFEALAQPTQVTDLFTISEAYATNYLESADDIKVPVEKNSKDVTILLIDHIITKYFDNNPVDETAGEKTSVDPFHYDDNEHFFRIETVPTATIEYTVTLDGEDITPEFDGNNNVVIKGEGTYVITYVATDETVGYAPVEGTFTITILKPAYVVEVGSDYVDNKDIVIVYTNTPNVGFSYKDKDMEMVDVSNSTYLYDDPRTDAKETVGYTYKFAYVVDFESGATTEEIISKYEENVIHWYKGDKDSEGNELANKSVGGYTTDVTDNGDLTVDDIVFAYGVARVYAPYFTTEKYQYRILRLDLDNTKAVKNEELTDVVTDVKAALGIQ